MTPQGIEIGDVVTLRDSKSFHPLEHGTKYCVTEYDNLTGCVELFTIDAYEGKCACENVPVEYLDIVDIVSTQKGSPLPKALETPVGALETQIGGSHYKNMPLQPIEVSMRNGLNACQHSILKYVFRYKHKGGKADLEKAKHFIDLLIELEDL